MTVTLSDLARGRRVLPFKIFRPVIGCALSVMIAIALLVMGKVPL